MPNQPLDRVRLSTRGRVRVVGESHYQPALRRAAGGRVVTERDLASALGVQAELVPEPRNRHDSNAVAVTVDDSTVGYLSRGIAPGYQRVLLDLERRGQRGWCQGWIMGGGKLSYGIHLHLADPASLVLENAPLVDDVLPPETMVAVVDEETYQAALIPLLGDRTRAVLYAHCRPPDGSGGNDAQGDRVAIDIDSHRVGFLTRRMSQRYSSRLAAHVGSNGHAPCEAMVHRTPRGIEVEVFLPRMAIEQTERGLSEAVGDQDLPDPETAESPQVVPPAAWPPELDVPPAKPLGGGLQPATKPGRSTAQLVEAARALATELRSTPGPLEKSRERVRERASFLVDVLVDERIAGLSIDRLTELADGKVRVSSLKSAGVNSVADVLAARDLTRINGVGRRTATRMHGAAQQLATLVREGAHVRFDPDQRPDQQTSLLAALSRHRELLELEPPLRQQVSGLRASMVEAAEQAGPAARGFWHRLFAERDDQAAAAVARLEQTLATADREDVLAKVNEMFEPLDAHHLAAGWKWFEREPAAVYAMLEALAGLATDHEAQEGHLPSEVVAAVRRQKLDTSFLDVSLRGYQAFGARYALTQGRVLIGDEMGLGKTIIALAVAAHLWSHDRRLVLVVCPASVLLNWKREIQVHTKMSSAHLHGAGREREYDRWRRDGGVAVTTFGTLGALPGLDVTDLLVIDEAHYVKNPEARRAQHVTQWGRHAEHVIYMTGTPLENRVSEFRELVGQLRPDVAEPLSDHFALAGSDGFRRQVAPVYLRRNQEDVLTELPGKLEVQDWVEPTQHDDHAYRQAVASGNFQAMRQAPWVHAASAKSAKMHRLREVVDESAAQGWKVVVFSFFRNTLSLIADGLDGVVFGPLTGSTSARERLDLVDAFTAHVGPAVLVAQIEAGGVGLNIQAASVVILAEPQWKPSTEDQAIARAHRMGQVRRVNVHRLLATPGVDLRMRELVAMKAAIFDEYARQSTIADVAPDALDRSEGSMMEQILQEESERLGIAAGR